MLDKVTQQFVLHCIEKQHKKQEKVGGKIDSIDRMRAGLTNYGQLNKAQSGRSMRGAAAQTNRYNKQTDYTKYFMSSSDEEAELYAVENGYGGLEGEGDIGLSRRDRRAAKRDQKKWDEKKEAALEEDDEEEEQAQSASEGSESSEQSEERPTRGRPRKNAPRDVPAGGGRGTRGRRGQAASN